MRNSSVPAEMIWPLVTLRLMIRPETGARMVAWLRRVWVSDRDAWAEARLAAEARWLARDGVQRSLAEEALLLQLLGARQRGVVAGDIGFRRLDRGLLLAQLGAQQDVVHLHQGLTLTDVRALIDIEADRRQAAGLGADRHFFPGRDRCPRPRPCAQAGQSRGRGRHRLAGRAACSCLRLFGGVLPCRRRRPPARPGPPSGLRPRRLRGSGSWS
jgi:hypothetical protein